MQTAPGQLVVRQHERYRCMLPARVSVGAESAARVVLSGDAAGGEPEVVAEVIDCSAGGLGLRSATFFPKLCVLTIRVPCPGPGGSTELIELAARVQRAAMTDRIPSYYVGAAFLGDGPEHERRVARLLAAANHSAPSSPEAPRV